MKKIFPILLAIAVVSLASNCTKSTPDAPCCTVKPVPGSLDMNFKAMYAAKPLVISQVYDYNGKKVMFEKLQFFISYDASSLDGTAGEVLPNTALVKLTNLTDTASAAAGVTTSITMASKTWTSINFALGVPKAQNAKLPKDFTFPDPLSSSDNFWDGWQSYTFTKLEGKLDKNGDGVFETPFTLHTGSDAMYRVVKFTKSYVIENNKTTTVKFELNLNELLKSIDLATVNSSHQIGETATMKIIMDNYLTALTVK